MGLDTEHVEPIMVAKKVIEGIYDGVTTSELDNLAAETAASMTVRHPDYASLASRIAVSNLHKNTKKSFSATMRDLYHFTDPKSGRKSPMIADDVFAIIDANADVLDSSIIYDRDFQFDYFGFKTLEKILFAESEWPGGRTPAAFVHAREQSEYIRMISSGQ
jgi:ribonucleoside-diphosphate reductase alpha chain